MSDTEFSLSCIKCDPDTDGISYITNGIKVEDDLNDTKFKVDLKDVVEDVKLENRNENFISFKQEEVYIKDETPTTEPKNSNQDTYDCEPHSSTASKTITSRISTACHEGKPFACNYCEYKASQKNNLTRHMLTHTGEKPFKCDFCDFKTAQKYYLIRHVRIHTGVKPFTCNLCEFKTTQTGHLRDHVRMHTGEKPFACNLCKYATSQRSNLMRHIRSHTGNKPYACKFCAYKTAQNNHLKRHMKNHTREKPCT